MSANKKILISVLVFILVIAAIVGVLLIVGNREEEEPTTEPIPVTTTVLTTDPTTEPVSHTMPTTSPAMNNTHTLSQLSQIEAYVSGTYYISATMVEDGVETSMDMAVRGKDFQTTMDMDGMLLSVLYMNGSVYFVNEDDKTYMEFSNAQMKLFGVDLSEMEELTESLNLSGYDFKGMEQTQTELGGYTADCYRYYTDDVSVWFYFIGDEMKQIDFGDADGNIASTLTIQAFSPTIPGNMLSLSGLKKSDMMSFFTDMAG